MAEHQRAMDRLLADRENRALKRSVTKLTVAELRAELEARTCSLSGEIVTLQDRLLRAVMREDPRHSAQVPWYAWDDLGAEGVEPRGDFIARKNKKRSRRAEKPRFVSRGTQTDSSDEEMRTEVRTVAQVHASPVEIPVTTSAATSFVTSAPTTVFSAMPQNVFSGVIKPYSPGEVNVTNAINAPRLSINPELASYLRQTQGEWEIYSAERVRKFRAPLPGAMMQQVEEPAILPADTARHSGTLKDVSTPKPASRTPRMSEPLATPLPPTGRKAREWFTPMQTFAEIEDADSETGSSGSETADREPPALEQKSVTFGTRRTNLREASLHEHRGKMEADRAAFEKELSASSTGAAGTDGEATALRSVRKPRDPFIAQRRASRIGGTDSEQRGGITGSSEEEGEWPSAERRRQRRAPLTRADPRPSAAPASVLGSGEPGARPLAARPPHAAEPDLVRARRASTPPRYSASTHSGADRQRASHEASGVITPMYGRRHAPPIYDALPRDFAQHSQQIRDEPTERPAFPAGGMHACDPKERAIKLLKNYGLKFNGEGKLDDPDEFWEKLEDARQDSTISDRGIISALPCILAGRAGRWFRTVKANVRTWDELRQAFRAQFRKELDQEDLWEDLRRRTQAKGEIVANFVSSIRYIVSYFAEPPSDARVVEMAWRNLLPEYRRAMGDKIIDSLEDIERLGRKWERQRDLDRRYVPPPPMNDFHLAGAGYSGTLSRGKIAAVDAHEDDPNEVAAIAQPSPKAAPKKKEGAGRKSRNECKLARAAPQRHAEAAQPVVAAVVKERSYARVAAQPPPVQQIAARESAAAGARPTRTNDSWPRPPEKNPYAHQGPATRSTSAVIGPNGEFIGACFKCQAVGHRASECPEVVCYACQQKGHVSRDCRERRASWSNRPNGACQSCGTPGATFITCKNAHCVSLRAMLGNGASGGPGQ